MLHREDFAEVFRQTVHTARASGLAKLGRVAIDGSKIRANTSRHKAMSHKRMKQAEEARRLQKEESKLKEREASIQKDEQEILDALKIRAEFTDAPGESARK